MTHSFFFHLSITNVNWVVNFSKNIYLGLLVFQLGIFVNVRTLLTNLIAAMYIILLKIDFVLSDHIKTNHLAAHLATWS